MIHPGRLPESLTKILKYKTVSILIFNGALDRTENATSYRITNFLVEKCEKLGLVTHAFHLVEYGIPLFDVTLEKVPKSVQVMNQMFRNADFHIWLTPLYHGSMTGVMKNCLDWLEVSSKLTNPYLTDKTIGLVCWADGVQAMQGINAMDSVAKSLRAWTAPLSVPIQRPELFDEDGKISNKYEQRFDKLINLMVNKKETSLASGIK